MKLYWILFVCIAGVLLCNEALVAHGGSYMGPGGTVAPSSQPPGSPTPPPAPTPSPSPSPTPTPTPTPYPGGASPTPSPTPSPVPSGASPAAGMPGRSAGASGTSVQRRNIRSAQASFQDWDFWWGFNKDQYLKLKENLYNQRVDSETADFFFGRRTQHGAKDTCRPTPEFIRVNLIPRFLEALGADQPDIRDSACVALGKVGGATEVPHLVRMVRDKVKSVREGAVIGLGLLQVQESIPPLLAILEVTREGQKIRNREPEYRLRAFAATSLGLIGDNDKGEVKNLLKRISADKHINRNITVNCTIGLGLLKGDPAYLEDITSHLDMLATRNARKNDWIRAHAVVALGRIHERNKLQVDEGILKRIACLARRDRSNHVRRSAIIVLGSLVKNPDAQPKIVKLLRSEFARGKDNQCRHFAAISLGQIGGEAAFKTLRRGVLQERNQRGAYAALGLAILCEKLLEDKTHLDRRLSGLNTLRAGFAKMRSPQIKGGMAIALGIARDYNAGQLLLTTMKKSQDIALRGYLAIALGMINYTNAVEYLTHMLDASTNLPLLKQQVAIGLGLMGTREIIPPLINSMKNASSTYAMGSVTKALGLIGDRTAIQPLVDLMIHLKAKVLARSFACVALGTIGEDAAIPVLATIAANHNYLASTEALNELMDIL